MGSGLAFWRWTYTTATVTIIFYLFPLKLDSGVTTYINTGCDITFLDKTWLLGQLLKQKINEMSTLLKVREIDASKHKSA